MPDALPVTHGRPALVIRPAQANHPADEYLLLPTRGGVTWTTDPASATKFDSMREATRAALRLPASLRAFGLPLNVELGLRRMLD